MKPGSADSAEMKSPIIRLQDLGLLVNKTGTQMDWNLFCQGT
jgi:hypothetical protein